METLKLAKTKNAINKCKKMCGICRIEPRFPQFHQTNARTDDSRTDERVLDAPTNVPNKEATHSTPHTTGLGTTSWPEAAGNKSPQESDGALHSVII